MITDLLVENDRLIHEQEQVLDKNFKLMEENDKLRRLLRWAVCWAEEVEEEHPSDNNEVFHNMMKEVEEALK